MTDRTKVASKGEKIRDPQGRVIATITRDVFFGEQVHPTMFELPDGSMPKATDLMPPAVAEFVASRRRPHK